MEAADLRYEQLKREWTDQFVEVNPARPELRRFEGIVGRVVTVNYNDKAIVDFQDGGWYDISASDEYLRKLDPADGAGPSTSNVNSAQPIPRSRAERAENSMILLIDNYDSFTYNLVQRLGELDANLDVRVFRNDQITPDEVAATAARRTSSSRRGPARRARPASPTRCCNASPPRCRPWASAWGTSASATSSAAR